MNALRGLSATLFVACLTSLALSACVYRAPIAVEEMAAPSARQQVTSPVKAHLLDYSLIYFAQGVIATSDSLIGAGQWYGPTMEFRSARTSVPLDSVVGFEALHGGGVNAGSTALRTVLATAGILFASAAFAFAAFGSCPTFYTSAGPADFRLEAEGFSYSITPLLEARDVDVLRGATVDEGRIRLEVRNEALETHFLNHVELLAIELAAGEDVLPNDRGQPLAFRPMEAVLPASDRAGRNVTGLLAKNDELAFQSSPSVVARAVDGDPFEHVTIELPPMPGVVEAAIVLRARNSLLTTLLFYDLMLAPAGLEAVDWLTETAGGIGPAIQLGRWAREFLGLRVDVQTETGDRRVAHLPDVGPIAWEEIVVPVPLASSGPTTVRISFLADAWRIDRVGLAVGPRTPAFRPLPATEVLGADGATDTDARAALTEPDERYLETRPGQRFTMDFQAGDATPGNTAYLLVSQGYYTEWVRRDWVRAATRPTRFEPSRAAVGELLARWTKEKDSLEGRFFSTKIPVR